MLGRGGRGKEGIWILGVCCGGMEVEGGARYVCGGASVELENFC